MEITDVTQITLNGVVSDVVKRSIVLKFNGGFAGNRTPEEWRRKPLTLANARAIAERCPSVEYVSPYLWPDWRTANHATGRRPSSPRSKRSWQANERPLRRRASGVLRPQLSWRSSVGRTGRSCARSSPRCGG